MFRRPFTCIFKSSTGTSACIIDAPSGAENARAAAEEKLPGAEIIAMIPGMHAGHTYTYSDDSQDDS
jgi:hypothetical protein